MSIMTAFNANKETLNPFSLDVRRFKTSFNIVDPDTMMDFGFWILARCDDAMAIASPKVAIPLEFLYELMRHEERLNIIIEESYEEIFVTMKLENPIDLKPKAVTLLSELGDQCIVGKNIASIRIRVNENEMKESNFLTNVKTPELLISKNLQVTSISPAVCQLEIPKEVRMLQSNEEQMLRQSFVNKTSASDYVCDIGGDVLDEIRDLESLDEEWLDKLQILETEPTVENIKNFADGVLGIYVGAINNLFEFAALSYALSSLGMFLKEHADVIIEDTTKLKTMIMLLEYLGADLTTWRKHIFALQDTADIHYLDSSFFSSCMQIEGIMSNKEVVSEDDDDGIEFF